MHMKSKLSWAGAFAAMSLSIGTVRAAESTSAPLAAAVNTATIGYVLTERHWAVYTTPDGKTECPNGFNDGPREQFAQLFPNDGTKRTLLETQLKREGEVRFPTTAPDGLVFKQAGGHVSLGMNLDGRVKDTDFTSPDGEKGIDNQLYRAIGCIPAYRGPNGSIYHTDDESLVRWNNNRFLIEITAADNPLSDGDVTLRSYRSLDRLMTDATGAAFMPGTTQHVDERWGKFAQATWKAKIVNGLLLSEPADFTFPMSALFSTSAVLKLKGARFMLRLTPTGAEGLVAGYVDVEQFYRHLNTSYSTHLLSYGQVSSASLYRALRSLADGYPDPKTGEMTAISSALQVKFTQAYLVHPPARTDQNYVRLSR
jgi:hypothetical protein